MNNSKKVDLDYSRLYGFRIAQPQAAEKCLAPKIGGKTPPAPALSPKIGGKIGFKPTVTQ